MMDVGMIVAAAVPFLVKGAEAFAGKAGEKLAGKAGELCRAVEKRFTGDSYAEQTLARAREMPESEARQGGLRAVLAETMEADPDFAKEVGKLVEELEKGRGTAFDQRGQMVYGPQTNIAGSSVRGTVFSGAFSGPVNIEKPE
ncbi:MAG: hypothetical protein JW986_01960 [Methanotrichaceae archaeon]|nr:hypothetical protein [Methanotrichaceae archaeon]